MGRVKPLSHMRMGETGVIVYFRDQEVERKLASFGFFVGIPIRCVGAGAGYAAFGEMIFLVGSKEVVISRDDARRVFARMNDPEPAPWEREPYWRPLPVTI